MVGFKTNQRTIKIENNSKRYKFNYARKMVEISIYIYIVHLVSISLHEKIPLK